MPPQNSSQAPFGPSVPNQRTAADTQPYLAGPGLQNLELPPPNQQNAPVIPQAVAAQGSTAQLPVQADNDPNSPRPSQQQQVSQHGDVEIQHAPGLHPQYGYEAAQQLQPINTPAAQPQPAAYPAPGKPTDEPSSPYAFFLEQQKQQKKNLGKMAKSSSPLVKIIAAAAGVVAILIVAAVIISANRGPTDDTAGTLATIVQDQQEIIRVSDLGSKNVQSISLQNYVATASVTTKSAQQDMITHIQKRGGKVDTKALATYKKDAAVDSSLTTALAAGTYDSAFQTQMQQILTDYQTDIVKLNRQATVATDKTLLKKNYDAVILLETMLNQQ